MFGRKKKNEISVKLDKLPALTEQEQLNLGIRQITRLPEKVSPPDRGGES